MAPVIGKPMVGSDDYKLFWPGILGGRVLPSRMLQFALPVGRCLLSHACLCHEQLELGASLAAGRYISQGAAKISPLCGRCPLGAHCPAQVLPCASDHSKVLRPSHS
jgi:hypothetical protein